MRESVTSGLNGTSRGRKEEAMLGGNLVAASNGVLYIVDGARLRHDVGNEGRPSGHDGQELGLSGMKPVRSKGMSIPIIA